MHICEKYNLAGTSPVNFVLAKNVLNYGFRDSSRDSRTDLLEWSMIVTFAIADYLMLKMISDDGRMATLW
jgi:hypothetical protein